MSDDELKQRKAYVKEKLRKFGLFTYTDGDQEVMWRAIKMLILGDTQIGKSQAINKFNEQVKIKSPATIVHNFSPLKVGLENKKDEYKEFI